MVPGRVELVEYTDPGCSWAWGSEPKLRLLRWRFGDRIDWRRVMGGLVGDMDDYVEGTFDPARAAESFVGYWADVAGTTGMPYPARLRWMYRSTEPACLAVKAAELQGSEVADAVLRRLREGTFVFGEPPDDPDRILACVSGTWGLDLDRFGKDLVSEKVRTVFQEDWQETRHPNDYVRNLNEEGPGAGNAKHSEGHWRYVFPTVVVRGPAGERTIPGWKDFERYEQDLQAVAPGVTDDPSPDPKPKEAFETWGTMAPRELRLLCGSKAKPPKDVVTYDWGDGVFYLSKEEAEARGID